MGEKLRRPDLNAFTKHCEPTSVRVAPHKTLTDSYTRFLPEAQPYLNFYDSDTQIQNVYYYNAEVYRLKTMVGSVGYLTALLKYTGFCYLKLKRMKNWQTSRKVHSKSDT